MENLSADQAAEQVQDFTRNLSHNLKWGVKSAEVIVIQKEPPIYGLDIVIRKEISVGRILSFFLPEVQDNIHVELFEPPKPPTHHASPPSP